MRLNDCDGGISLVETKGQGSCHELRLHHHHHQAQCCTLQTCSFSLSSTIWGEGSSGGVVPSPSQKSSLPNIKHVRGQQCSSLPSTSETSQQRSQNFNMAECSDPSWNVRIFIYLSYIMLMIFGYLRLVLTKLKVFKGDHLTCERNREVTERQVG